MLTKEITYTNFDDEKVTDKCYFNLSSVELTELQFSEEGGIDKKIQRMIDTTNVKEIIKLMKDIILMSYGEKSEDGKKFIKVKDGKRLAEEFEQSAAFDALYMELVSDDVKASAFIEGILPKDLVEKAKTQQAEIKPIEAKPE